MSEKKKATSLQDRMEKVNPWSMGTEEEANDPNLSQDYWVGYDDSCLVVGSGCSPDGPKVWLTDQMLVWLAIEGLCRLRDHYDKLDAEIEKMKADGLIPCTCPSEPPLPPDKQDAIKAMAFAANERCKCGDGFHPPSEKKP